MIWQNAGIGGTMILSYLFKWECVENKKITKLIDLLKLPLVEVLGPALAQA